MIDMINIKIDVTKFQNISFEETLSYRHYPALEKAISDVMDYLEIEMNTLSRKKVKVTESQKIAYFLKKALLSITTDPTCIKTLEECTIPIDSDYIHIILKKHYFRLEYDFESLIN
jgi:uncharacterized ubiquitin-like protein YukD